MDRRKQAQREQWERAASLIGPLLDAWDSVPNDAKAYVIECVPFFGRLINELDEAMEGNDDKGSKSNQ